MQTSAVIADLMTQPPIAGTPYALGRSSVDAEAGPGRISFVMIGGTYEPAERHKGTNPRAIMTRVARYDAYCWADNQDDAETLLNNLCAAIQQSTGDFRLLSDRNLEGLPDADETLTDGVALVLSFELRVPVTLPADTAVQLVSSGAVAGTSAVISETNVSMQFPDGNVVTGTPAP